METGQNKGREGEGSGGREVRRIRKRIKLSTAACRTTRASESDFELVQFSIDKSKPLLTVQILPEAQAEPFNSLIDLGATANFISPKIVEKFHLPKISLNYPRNIHMLDGSLPKTGKVWSKVSLKFTCQGIPSSAEFLVCPIGENQAILGMPWLKDQNPDINWREHTISLSETIQIASEEEVDKDPLQSLPSIYHEFSKVFGKKNSRSFPPIDLMI
jgi:hypothetical protein